MSGGAITRRTLVYDGWYRVSRLEVTLEDSTRIERHLIDNGGAVAVLPFDPVRRTALLVSQARAAVLDAGEPPLLEAIAGGLDADAPAQARAEALEEAGVRLHALDPVANVWTIPTVSTERVQLYLAEYGAEDRVASGGGADTDERITVHEIGLDAVRAMALAGTLTDAKTLILIYALIVRRPDLWLDKPAVPGDSPPAASEEQR